MTESARNQAETLRRALIVTQTNAEFSEAVITLCDGTRICFCHKVGERWAKAVGPEDRAAEPGLAGELLAAVAMFRLNARHLEIQFDDGSRWEYRPEGGEASLAQ